MRAAVLISPGRVEVREVAMPEPGEDEILIQLEGCGVCASNLPVWQGREWFEYPIEPGAPGHEGWGRVAAAGSRVEDLRPGDRVAFLSGNAYAEYDCAPAAHAVRISEAIPHFPGEAIGCAFNILRRSVVSPGETVAVIGVGFLGAILTALAKKEGARVLAISRRPFALELACHCGAEEAIPLEDHGHILERVAELTGGAMCERVIEATGLQGPLDLAGELAATRGRLIIAGYHQDGPRSVNLQQWNWKGLDVINAHERDPRVYVEGMRLAVEAVASGRVDLRSVCTHTFPLERMEEAYRAMAARPDGFVKGMITFK